MEGGPNNDESPRMEQERRGGFKYVPEEIVRNLLANLPLESLLRFRCISKHLSCQISKHITKTKVQKVIVHTDQTFLLRSVDKNARVEDIEIEVGETITRDNPIHFPRVYGSCNEFLLIRAGVYLFLWNPSTGRSHGMIRNRILMQYPRDRVIPGLCYDSENDDYKVVLGLNHRNWRERSVRVGSFKLKTWSRLDIKFNIGPFKPGPTLNNYLHWWSPKEILSFDPKIETFTKISLPKEFGDYNYQINGLGVLDGCLSMVVGYYFNVYRRKHCGVSEPWDFMFSLPFSNEYQEYIRRGWFKLDHITPLFFTDEKRRMILIRFRRTECEHYFCLSCDYYGEEGPQTISDEYVIIAYDAHEISCKDIVASSFEKIAYDGAAVYEETIVRPVSMRKEVPGEGKKVWKLKVCETKVVDGEEEKKVIVGIDGIWEERRRMRGGKKSTARVIPAPVDPVLSTKNAFDLLNESE